MTVVEHLRELRYRVGVSMAALVVGGLFGIWWFSHRLFGLPSLADILLGPYCALPPTMRFSPGDGGCRLLQTAPFEVFALQLKVGFTAGAVLLSPVWLHQLWAFITPGLRAVERRFAAQFVGFGSVLFVAGALLAYSVVPAGLAFMVGFGGDAFYTALTGAEYVRFVLLMLFLFGVCFELPLLVVMLNRAEVLSYAALRSWWRGIVFGLFVLSAVATPQDPISMLALGTTLCALFAVALAVCRRHDRRRRVAAPDVPSPEVKASPTPTTETKDHAWLR
ncbi:twin-arginine translocase subunit TatC [Saccharopolyspora flava]|uniref:Sec-independent protein translocase protein TatC n=1 Tax=Saccharopolyspora flava TaxID=95161 RepID=A0A1I6RL23_9PSEU|nr:twin-arginine translocase subunit TatC [Saccharopolyspora flava]SFS65158.1 sec-independent protein translocase protein TatC [Saccharopolyspora flava]